MFSVVFPGQGSQKVGMVRELYHKYDLVKKLINDADQILETPIKKIIFDGPEHDLNLTENTQPAIFLASYSIFQVTKKEFGFNFKNAKHFAGHSLGEYTALACANSISFEDALRILKKRGKFMQEAIPNSEGGMIAVMGSNIKTIETILNENKKNYECFIANDNSNQQVVVSGLIKDIEKFSEDLNLKKIKNIKLKVSAPFHCKLMKSASENMSKYILDLEMKELESPIVSNVTARSTSTPQEIKKLLILQIEEKVRWVESINFMLKDGINKFIEIGPGKVLSGLIKRINRDTKITSINNEEDMKALAND